jgi:hypothetical protein
MIALVSGILIAVAAAALAVLIILLICVHPKDIDGLH